MKSEPAWDALPAGVPPRLVTVLRRCLDKNPIQRLRDIGDMRLAFEGAFDVPPGSAPLVAMAAPVPPPLWRRAATHVMALLLGTTLGGLLIWTTTQPPVPRVARFQIPLAEDAIFPASGRQLVALSANGRSIAYMANNQLHLRQVDQLAAVPVRGTTGARNPVFSPDGQSIAFFEGDALKRIGIAGGAPVVIAKAANPWGMSWTEDDAVLYGQGPGGIFRVPAAGGTPENLIKVSEGDQAHGPQLLPGGEWVLFTLRPKGSTAWNDSRIVVHSLRTGEQRVVVSGGRDGRYVPTGHLIYGLNGALLAAPFNLGSLQAGGAVSLIEGVSDAANNTGTVHFSVASNGSLLYLPGSSGGRTSLLVLVDRQGREELLAAEPRQYTAVRISPDGTQLAAYDLTGPNTDIWVWHLLRQTLTRLTFDPAPDRHPLWSADGSRIVFQSDRDGGGLFWQAADGTGTAERLLETPSNPSPFGWSPDGSLIFDEIAPTRNIRILKMSGDRTATTLLGTEFSERRPALSPDGRWLAYESDESGQYEVYVRPFPAVNDGKWQVSRGGGSEPSWSARGDELYYLSSESLVAIPIQPGTTFTFGSPKPLVPRSGYQFPNQARDYAVLPDGRFLLLKAPPSEGAGTRAVPLHLVLVENWFEELRQRVPTGN